MSKFLIIVVLGLASFGSSGMAQTQNYDLSLSCAQMIGQFQIGFKAQSLYSMFGVGTSEKYEVSLGFERGMPLTISNNYGGKTNGKIDENSLFMIYDNKQGFGREDCYANPSQCLDISSGLVLVVSLAQEGLIKIDDQKDQENAAALSCAMERLRIMNRKIRIEVMNVKTSVN